MEKQSFELTQGMKKHAIVHLLCCDGSESKVRFFGSLKSRIKEKLRLHPGISILHFNDGLAAAFCSGANDFPELHRSVTLHGLDAVFPNAYFQKNILPRFNRFQSIIAVSQATADACIKRGLNAQKITVIPNGVDHDIARYQPSEAEKKVFSEKHQNIFQGKKTLVMMGRPVLRKGFSWFLQSVLPLLSNDFQVLIIGPFREKRPLSTTLLHWLPTAFRKQLELLFGLPSDEDTLRVMLQSPEVLERVRHLGRLPFTDIMQIMSASDAFIMPNIAVEGDMEGFGLVCLEANLNGLPVFAANIDGITDAVQHQKNGWLIPSQDAAAWASALLFIQENSNAVHAFGQKAREYVLENFGWEKMALEYYEHFSGLGSPPSQRNGQNAS